MDSKLLEAFAARAEQKQKSRAEAKTFALGGVETEFVKPKQSDQLAYYEALSESAGAADLLDTCVQLIYDCCPALQDAELQQTLGVTDPYDTVRRLLDLREIDQLGGALMTWLGLIGSETRSAEDTAKNS